MITANFYICVHIYLSNRRARKEVNIMKAKYKKSIILASSALSLMVGAAIVLSSNENLFSIMMRAANQTVTDGTIAFSGSNTVKSSGTRTTVGRTVTGMPIVCKSTGNDANAPQAYVAAMKSGTVISFCDTSDNEFEFQKVKGLSITKAQEWGTLIYNFSYTLTDGTSGTTSNQPSHTTTGMVYYNLATICGGNLAKLSINCVSATGNAYISDIVLTYDCGPIVYPDLDSIEISTEPTKTSYYVGETFDPTGMVVTATYSDATSSTVSGYTYSTSALTLEDDEIEISYTERGITKTATQEITVEAAPVLQSIAVTTAPTTTTYTEGDYFDPTGMVVTATYDKGPTRDVTDECTFSPDEETALTTSDTSVTISYGGQSTTQSITVNQASSTSIAGSYVELLDNSTSYRCITVTFVETTSTTGTGSYHYYQDYKSNDQLYDSTVLFSYVIKTGNVVELTFVGYDGLYHCNNKGVEQDHTDKEGLYFGSCIPFRYNSSTPWSSTTKNPTGLWDDESDPQVFTMSSYSTTNVASTRTFTKQ